MHTADDVMRLLLLTLVQCFDEIGDTRVYTGTEVADCLRVLAAKLPDLLNDGTRSEKGR